MIVGITGHQDLGDARRWVRNVLTDEIAGRPVTRECTALAAGADQVFAEVMLELGIPYEVVRPSARYEQTLSDASRYNRVGLLVPVDAPHMWHAAMESKSCRLTGLGEHYRQLAENKRI